MMYIAMGTVTLSQEVQTPSHLITSHAWFLCGSTCTCIVVVDIFQHTHD